MFILGCVSILQASFFPGFLVIRKLRMNDGLLRTLLLSFPLSLIINHLVVLLLTTLHIYNRSTILTLFGAEIILFAWIARPSFTKPIQTVFDDDTGRVRKFYEYLKTGGIKVILLKSAFVLIGMCMLFYMLLQVWKSFGQIFSQWDDVVSWNRCAIDWYSGIFARWTGYYPQLIPINWSLIYMFLGSPVVQFFAKAIMPLFPLAILVSMLDLGLRSKQIGYIIGISVTGILLIMVAEREGLSSGYVDIPVAFMAFIPVYLLLTTQHSDPPESVKRNVLLGAVLCAGAASTKQAGLYLLLFYPVLCYLLLFQNMPEFKKKDTVKLILASYVIMIVLTAPWYVHHHLQVLRGIEKNEISGVADVARHGKTNVEIFFQAINLIEKKVSYIAAIMEKISFNTVKAGMWVILLYALFILGSAFSLFNKSWRYLILLIVVPYFFIWVFSTSYDLRNLALAMPLIGASTGVGLQSCGGWLKERIKLNTIYSLLAGMALVIVVFNFAFDKGKLVDRQISLQKQIGDPKMDNILYDYHRQHRFQGVVLTNYQLMNYLPDLGQFCRLEGFRDLVGLKRTLQDPEVGYLLVIPWLASEDVNKYIEEGMKSNKFEQIPADIPFVKINRGSL